MRVWRGEVRKLWSGAWCQGGQVYLCRVIRMVTDVYLRRTTNKKGRNIVGRGGTGGRSEWITTELVVWRSVGATRNATTRRATWAETCTGFGRRNRSQSPACVCVSVRELRAFFFFFSAYFLITRLMSLAPHITYSVAVSLVHSLCLFLFLTVRLSSLGELLFFSLVLYLVRNNFTAQREWHVMWWSLF